MNALNKSFISFFVIINLATVFASNTIIGSWDFQNKSCLTGKYPIKTRGTTSLDKNGLYVKLDKPSQIGGATLLKKYPELTPKNAFEISATIIFDSNANTKANRAVIYDTKYVALPNNPKQQQYHKGFVFFLNFDGKKFFRPGAAFGFGSNSAQVLGKNVVFTPNKKYQLKMIFNALGKVSFFVDNKLNSNTQVPVGVIAKSNITPVFGNRVAANYQPLMGRLLKLELKNAPYKPVAFTPITSSRQVFERKEKNASLKVAFNNLLGQSLKYPITIKGVSNGVTNQFVLKNNTPKSEISFPIDTLLLPGTYKITFIAKDANNKIVAQDNIPYTIVKEYGDFLPVFLWGNYEDIKAIRDAGFTHQIVHLFPRIGNFQSKDLNKWIPHLDENLKHGLYTFGTLHAHFRFLQAKRFLRTTVEGKVYPRLAVEASNPKVQSEFAEAAYSTVKAVANHPAFDGVLLNSEVRDSSLPSFASKVEPIAFKKFAGYDIPKTIIGKSPKPYAGDTNFPWDKVISPKHPDLVFLRWFWDIGDGWNPLQTLLSQTIHKAVKGIEHKNRFFTFYDPVTRVPPLWGSGGQVDMISQWTYTYPDPIKIGQTTDEVIAMADGNPNQKIGSMTQAIWYRSQTAPINQKVNNPPSWLKDEPTAMFVSISPDSLREAFWVKISRRLDAIMYHGVGSLLAKTNHKLYRMTNYESKEVLKELNQKVILPLGPVLKRVPEKKFNIAILESLAASFYAPKHFPMGWGKNWTADLHLALQWGHFQPGIIYDEHLLYNRKIKDIKVLFVPGLEVVTTDILTKLNELRSNGVIIIGDEFTTPALMVDYRLKSITRDNSNPLKTKKELQELGSKLAKLLDKYAPRNVIASNQDLIVRQRGNNKADYVFVINDKRTFGNYIGQWKLVPEKGLANKGTITVNHNSSVAYNLVTHQEIPLKKQSNQCSFNVDIPPGDGMCVLLLDKKIEKIKLTTPQKIAKNRAFTIKVDIQDKDNNSILAILPVKVTLLSNNNIELPGSGYYAAINGKLTINEILPTNLNINKIKVIVKCLASSKTASSFITITK